MLELESSPTISSSQDVLAGGGEMGARMREIDWSTSPLGPVEQWPQSLKTCVRILLTCRQPMFVWWGEQLINLYNDAYKSIVGGKHPEALGQPASVVWREIWDAVQPRAESAMLKNEGTYDEALLLIMERYGYQEETYYTFSYSPVPNDQGGAGGIICTNTDDTQRIIGERQLTLLRELATSTLDARTVQSACTQSVGALKSNRRDLPFAMIYLADGSNTSVTLAGTSGIAAGHEAAPATVPLESPSRWPFSEVLTQHQPRLVDLSTDFGTLPTGDWDAPPRQAAVLPISIAGDSGFNGVLVVGLSPYRQYDSEYEGFISLVAGQISASFASALGYEEEKRRAEALAEIDRAKTAFFSNVSHEFRTPLTLMLGPLEDALRQPEASMDAPVREELQVVHRNGLRLLKLVNALLDFSRIEAGRMKAQYEPLDLATLTAELASAFRSAVEKAGMTLSVDCPSLSAPAYVDREMWEKIVLNLLSNAYKHTFEGSIQVSLRENSGMACLSVKDSGIGIAPEVMPRLFERFFRVAGSRSRTHEGSGIGLSLVQELVKQHGGSITAASEPGEGSTFEVKIPLGHAHLPADRIGLGRSSPMSLHADAFVKEAMRWADTGVAEHPLDDVPLSASPPKTEEAGDMPRVVVADDNADMRDYLRQLLSPSYRVTTVGNGMDALNAVQSEPTDLVLTDIMMPELDGFGLLRELRADPLTRDIPIIMLSARAGEEARIEGIDAGADDYLVKPFSARELLARVAANLRLVRLRRENAARVESILESTSDAFIAVDHTWRITYANSRYRKMVEPFVDASQDLVGQNLWEHVPGLAESEAGDRYRHAMRSQEPDSFEVYYDPLHIIMEVRAFPSPGMLSIYLRDITQRRATEEALHDTRDRLEATLSAAEIGTWTWDIEKNEVTADRKLAQLFPMMESGHPTTVDDYMQQVHPDDRMRVQQDITSALSGGRPGFECDLRLVMPDSSIRWVTARGRVQRDEEGHAVRFPGVLVDITARKRAEEALRSNELRLRAIFSQASTLIGIVGPDGVLLDSNDAALTAAKVRLNEEKGRPYWETSWWNQDAQVQARIRTAIEGAVRGKPSHFETMYFAGEGSKRWADVHVTPVTDAGKLAFILVEGRDITELNEARTALVQARDGAERASQAKDDFLASLSHELRTPLNPVLLLATEAARNSAFPKEAREDFDTIAKNVMLEARLIDDLLDLTLITRGKMPLDMGLRDAHEILRDAVSTVNMEMDQKSIALTLRLAAQEHQVWGDAVRLQQVFWNILKNAVKFTPSGGNITLSTRNSGPDNDLIIDLTDSGIGMTGEELARVFDYFTQGEHAGGGGSHRFGGLGLGLAISRMLVEMHAGSIRANSAGRNSGTTITIRLATSKMSASGRVTLPPEFREAVPVILVEDDELPSNLRILLVEDHEPTRVALAQLLKRRKHVVTTAGTVAEALAAAEKNTFDLVMSDIGLPDGTGNDLMRELRSRYKLRGIALTGYGMSEDIARTQAAGFMAHLTKPISVQSLDQALLAAHDRLM
ncbi:PAS domain S-box-containing protein [Roseimicrobium gellanilyticum]|uniref:histidine kinase n=1 Tax=Roseimicrobium gellanilyticum TaxID=748857 RepID=A0A366HPR9_9BACT|nr:ATP-binding protein [Roseimicrobium gellanilyticum]RBP44460.1 PAS domain S-box-containing protein [Roseimicrobium gellanilyticum]